MRSRAAGEGLASRGRRTTKCFVKKFAGNERDGQYRSIRNRDPKGHEALCQDFAPLKGSKVGELAARWDVVVGYSPEA